MRILVVYRGLPWPISEGYHLRVLHLFRRLAARHEVHLLGLVHEEEQAAQRPHLEADGFCASIHLEWLPKRSALGRLRTNLGFEPSAALKAEYPGYGRRLRVLVEDLVQRHGIDVGYAFDSWAQVLYSDALVVPTLLDVCDSRSFFYERQLERGDLSLVQRLRVRQLRRRFTGIERFTLSTYPVATVVSELDRAHLLSLVPDARVEVIPNGVDLEMFAPQPEVEEEPENLIFFGNMDFLPNVDAAVTVAREVLPRVRERHPGATFTVVGTNPVEEVRALAGLPGVEVTGGVPDLKPWIGRAAMLVAPMRFGAGIKNKVLETLAMEKPVVTNSTGAEAMYPEVRDLLSFAEDPEVFAERVCELLGDPESRRRIGRRGREVMARFHSWDAAASRYEELLAELAAGGAESAHGPPSGGP